MKIAVDFHIHSGLSPCADDDMTPNNIINLALLKGLDAIAITDHNCTGNLNAFLKVAQGKNLLCIPGIEVTTKEEVHLLALFKNLSQAQDFQKIIDAALPKINNNTGLFGCQLIYDESDNVVKNHDILLINAINLSIEETISEIKKLQGLPIPAHIDRNSFSILSNLGFISPELGITTVEISRGGDFSALKRVHPYLERYNRIYSSDAHYLGDILEREFFIEVGDLSIDAIFDKLSNV